MRKFGFTLSELIITLGIIGVVAAITSPMIDGIMPDKNKIIVLKAYKLINDVTKGLLNDKSLYVDKTGCSGLSCIGELPTNPKYRDSIYTTPARYGLLMYAHMETDGDYETVGNSIVKFKTADGIEFEVNGMGGNTGEDGLTYKSVTITTDIERENTCSYSSSCKKPNQFEFLVHPRGRVFGKDPLTKAYLENPYKLNDKKKDYARAKVLSSQ